MSKTFKRNRRVEHAEYLMPFTFDFLRISGLDIHLEIFLPSGNLANVRGWRVEIPEPAFAAIEWEITGWEHPADEEDLAYVRDAMSQMGAESEVPAVAGQGDFYSRHSCHCANCAS